ncbi:MAG: sulfide dehydrogenase [Candidatus Acidiferrales bacterium]
MRLVKRYFALLLGGSLVIALAAGLLFAQVEKGNYAPATLGQLQQPAPATLTDDSVYQVSAYPQYAPELAEGEGRAETASFCNLCHSARYITMQPPLPAATWEAEVTKMRKTFGAPIPDASAALILKYLQAHYTPETRKQ